MFWVQCNIIMCLVNAFPSLWEPGHLIQSCRVGKQTSASGLTQVMLRGAHCLVSRPVWCTREEKALYIMHSLNAFITSGRTLQQPCGMMSPSCHLNGTFPKIYRADDLGNVVYRELVCPMAICPWSHRVLL